MARHLLKKINSKKISVKKTLLADENFVRSLRNNKKLRKINFLEKEVGKKEHHDWFTRLLEKDYSYTVFLEKIRIGHIRFERVKPEVFLIGLAFFPKYGGRGFGPLALKIALSKLRKKERGAEIIAEVRETNLQAQKFFLKMGFKVSHFVYKFKI